MKETIQLATAKDIDEHKKELVMSDEGVHGLRFDGEMLYAKDVDGVEHEIQTGGGGGAVMLANPTNVNITAKSRAIELTWNDPEDIEINGIKLAEWAGTRVVRKRDSAPTGKNDGTLVADIKVRNQHSETPLVDNNLTNDITYYYGVFPYTKTNLYNTDISVSATPRGARILVHADESTLIGETVTCYKDDEIVDTKTIESNRTAVFSFDEIGEYSFVCGNYKAFANVAALGQTVNVTLSTIIISITTSELELYEKPISVKLNDVEVATGTMSATGSASISVKDLGIYTIVCEDVEATVEVTEYGQTYEVELSGGILLSSLPVGAKIMDYGTKYYDKPIVWQILEHEHEGDPENSTALISEKILCLKCFDAKEPSNSDSNRKQYGNNRYLYSNIKQWLNSDADTWYSAQHSADTAPTNENVNDGFNDYDQEKGFLTNFSTQLKEQLLTVTKRTARNTVVDGGGYEDVSQKIFLLSNTEVGLDNENSIAEGSIYDYFKTGSNRISYPTAEAVLKSEYKDASLSASQPWAWNLRTPYVSTSYLVRFLSTSGSLKYISAFGSLQNSVRPACCIPQNTKLYKDPTADGVYVIKTNEKPSIGTVSNAELKTGNTTATIKWTDPEDLAPVVSWVGTKVVRKAGSAPQNVSDGVVIVDSTVRNQYAEEGFVDEGLTNDTEYFYGIFPYGSDNRYNYETVVSGTPTDLKIVTWADGTDEEIAAMLEAHYNNDLDIRDYWAVGDVRNINLAAMGASGITNSRNVAETHSAQVVQLVILDFEHDTLTTPINSHTKAAITVQTKDCLKVESNSNYQLENSKHDAGMGSMNNYSGTHTNSGGWESSARRTWCNGQFKNALPSTVKNIIKQVKIYTDNTGGRSNTASNVTATDDYAFLLAECEIWGEIHYSNSAEQNYQTQYEYFKTMANRYKNPQWDSSSTSGSWWGRSPRSGQSTYFCYVTTAGVHSYNNTGLSMGLAPAFCL